MRYDHTQHGPLHLLLVAVGAALLVAVWLTPIPALQIVLGLCCGFVLLLAASFQRLTVRDEVDRLAVRFGPVPLFLRSVPYSEIEGVERGRLTIADGWGLQWAPGRGTTWSLWGYDCVLLRLAGGKRLTIGTDDVEGLTAFLGERLAEERAAGVSSDRMRIEIWESRNG